jgi:hypothetical protein
MSGTLETTNNLILIKIKNLDKILCIIKKLDKHLEAALENDLKNNLDVRINSLHEELINISNDYEMTSVKILADYFLLVQNFHNRIKISEDVEIKRIFLSQKTDAYSKYQTFIKKDNYVGKIDRCYTSLKRLINSISQIPDIMGHMTEIKSIFLNYSNSTIIRNITNISYTKCTTCNKDMKIIAGSSEIICEYCGVTESLYGTVFEDEQFYYQEGQRSKHGSYDPSKHCKFWLERIQARESKEIPNFVITKIKKCISDNKIRNTENLSCKDIRKYLSQTRNTTYNDNVPLIRKIVTGRSPPQLSDQELQMITLYFDKVIRVYDGIKPITKTNVPYHPYLIYKIIEHLLHVKSKDTSRINLRRAYNILSCIHLQSRETLIENDNTWKQICKYLEIIKYYPTDRNDQFEDF